MKVEFKIKYMTKLEKHGIITVVENNPIKEMVSIGQFRYSFTKGSCYIEQVNTVLDRTNKISVPKGFSIKEFRTFISTIDRTFTKTKGRGI